MNDLTLVVGEDNEGSRIDSFLAEYIDDISRSYVKKLIEDENITVDGKKIKPSYKVCFDDHIYISLPESHIPDIIPQDIPLDILYEDNDILIVNKPKGMVVHPAAGHYTDTLVNAIMYHCKDSLSGINGVLRPGIVHRIDKDTTGSVIVCKNDDAHRYIASLLKEHDIVRKYHLIVCGVLKDDEGTIDAPIGRDPKNRLKMCVRPDGKRAVTHYRVLKRFEKYTYVECTLETGRTHQIRVHMANLGHPVLGDETYGARSSFKLEGQCLHAKILNLKHPNTNEMISTDAPLPDYFVHLLEVL